MFVEILSSKPISKQSHKEPFADYKYLVESHSVTKKVAKYSRLDFVCVIFRWYWKRPVALYWTKKKHSGPKLLLVLNFWKTLELIKFLVQLVMT